jgi:hypothetical protein
VKEMRYIKRKEIHVLCHLYSEFENLKRFLDEYTGDLLINSPQAQTVGRVDLFSLDTSKLSKFNNKNLQLIKNIALNDVLIALKRIRNFIYLLDKERVSFLIDLSSILNDYEKNMEHSFMAVEKCMFERVDSFLLDMIVVVTKFEPEQYFAFRDFFRSIKESFKHCSGNKWKTDMGCKCVEDIFNGRECDFNDDPLFKLIYDNYA